MSEISRLTGGPTEKLFTATVLGRHRVEYHRCVQTGFIQTTEPHWLEEAYQEPITRSDVGYVSRNLNLARRSRRVLNRMFPDGGVFLDHGGGYGMFVRLMRDLGYDFYRSDPHCENLFAQGFDLAETPADSFDAITAFEVLEHLPHPLDEIDAIFECTDTLVCSTELAPSSAPRGVGDWGYFAPEHGQHVAFYTRDALLWIARRVGARLYSNGANFHVLTRRRTNGSPLRRRLRDYARAAFERALPKSRRRRRSLLMTDAEAARRLTTDPGREAAA